MPKKYERDPKSGSVLLIGQMVVRPFRNAECAAFRSRLVECGTCGRDCMEFGPIHDTFMKNHAPFSTNGIICRHATSPTAEIDYGIAYLPKSVDCII